MSDSRSRGRREGHLSDLLGNVVLALLWGFVPLLWSLLMIGQTLARGRFASSLWAQGFLILGFGLVGVAGLRGMRRAFAREVRISDDGVTLVGFIGTETIAWSDIDRFEVTHLDAEAASYLGTDVRLHDDRAFRLPLGPLMGVTGRSRRLYRFVDQLNAQVL
jgi:hypothetical protein